MLTLIRHTTPAIDKGICYGQLDVPLDAAASEAQWRALQQQLETTVKWQGVYSSPLSRCLWLAQKLAAQLALPLYTDDRLMELHFGKWEGLAWNELPPDELNPWMEQFVTAAPPGGESFEQLHQRVGQWWQQAKQPALVVTHAGVIRSLCCHVHGTPLSDAFAAYQPAYGSMIALPAGHG
ncbi:MAG: alpha-ribazole phosphatase [Chitinophagaceae bacterium]|jgi:alpha-ribazole phosphatase|nr:alpha-ribazole phosphatase [Chitinophagaceae bacterium]